MHYGIDTRSGAIDPLPFIKKQEISISNIALTFTQARTKLQKNELRTGVSTGFENLKSLSKDQVGDIEEKTQQRFHVRDADSLECFMHQSWFQN